MGSGAADGGRRTVGSGADGLEAGAGGGALRLLGRQVVAAGLVVRGTCLSVTGSRRARKGAGGMENPKPRAAWSRWVLTGAPSGKVCLCLAQEPRAKRLEGGAAESCADPGLPSQHVRKSRVMEARRGRVASHSYNNGQLQLRRRRRGSRHGARGQRTHGCGMGCKPHDLRRPEANRVRIGGLRLPARARKPALPPWAA